MSTIHEGGCLCGSVRYRVTGDPTWVGVCHCKQCQRWTGTAFFMAAYFLDTHVEVTGALKQYHYNSDESARWNRIEFCETCGTTITMTGATTPGERAITGGTFDDPDWLDFKKHIWTESAHHSVVIPPDATTFPAGQPL